MKDTIYSWLGLLGVVGTGRIVAQIGGILMFIWI